MNLITLSIRLKDSDECDLNDFERTVLKRWRCRVYIAQERERGLLDHPTSRPSNCPLSARYT